MKWTIYVIGGGGFQLTETSCSLYTTTSDRMIMAYCEPRGPDDLFIPIDTFEFLSDLDTTLPHYTFTDSTGLRNPVEMDGDAFLRHRFCVDHTMLAPSN